VKQAFQSRNSEGRDAESDRGIVLKLIFKSGDEGCDVDYCC
jgi:hypothetical protein